MLVDEDYRLRLTNLYANTGEDHGKLSVLHNRVQQAEKITKRKISKRQRAADTRRNACVEARTHISVRHAIFKAATCGESRIFFFFVTGHGAVLSAEKVVLPQLS